VTFNGHVSTKDMMATGQPIRACLISVSAEHEVFTSFILADPSGQPGYATGAWLPAGYSAGYASGRPKERRMYDVLAARSRGRWVSGRAVDVNLDGALGW
jgi:hypothetical protein